MNNNRNKISECERTHTHIQVRTAIFPPIVTGQKCSRGDVSAKWEDGETDGEREGEGRLMECVPDERKEQGCDRQHGN